MGEPFMTKNRLLILVGVLLIILIGVSVYVFAILMPNVGQSVVTDVTPTPSATVVPNTPAKLRRVTGIIQSVGNQSLVITVNHSSKTMTIAVDGQTQYTTNKGTASFSDLKVGETVIVRGHTNPQDATSLLASTITFKIPKK